MSGCHGLILGLSVLLVCGGSGQSNESVRVLSDAILLEVAPTSTCKETGTGSEWICTNLQAGLELAKLFNGTNSTISVLLPPGQHVLDSPVHLGSTSMELIGLQDTSGSPVTIECTYNIAVDQDQIFNLSYVYTDYTLYFNRSKSVSISNIDMNSCQFSLRLDTIGTVKITNSLFQQFTEAVLDIFNTANTTIIGCIFFNNSGTGISRNSFRANTGAVAIGFNNIQLDQQEDPCIFISNCNFTRNRATAESFVRSTSSAFFSRIFTGRGGGLGFFLNESQYNIIARINDNVFIDNYACSFGGGLFMVIFGGSTQNMFSVSRNVFENNVALLGAGGLLMTFFSVGVRETPHTTIISDCTFSGNTGESGGGVLTYIADEVNSFFVLERCNFTRNKGVGSINDFGSAYAVWLVGNQRERESLPHYHIIDCIFDDHGGSNGIVSIGYAPFAFYGRNVFSGNSGTGSLTIIGSLVDVFGAMEFTNNEASNAAAMELLSFAQVRLHNGAKVEFRENMGRFGASILVSTGIILRAFTTLAFNPQCFMQYENSAIPPSQWTNVSVKFRSNEAVLGSSLYASTFRACTWFSQHYPFFNPLSILEWPLWDLGNDSKNTGYDDLYSQEHQIGTEARVIDTPNATVTAWPGYNFKLPLTGWDEFNNPTYVATRFDFVGRRDIQVSFLPEVVVIESSGVNSTLVSEFSVKYRLSQSSVVLDNRSVGEVVLNVPFQNSDDITTDKLELYSVLCPGGYELSNSSGLGLECQCLEKTVDGIVNCELDQNSIIIQNGYWVSTTPSTNTHNHQMYFYTCPAGYCRCVQNSSVGVHECVYLYLNNYPDAQCSCNRHGILCGGCKNLGVSVLFNRCVSCSNAFIVLIPILVLVQVALFITIVLIDKQFWTHLYPFTFYVQVIAYTGSYFHETFLTAGQYLRYLGSAMSFYFPYDFCLYSNIAPLVSYALRFLPLLVAILVVPLTVITRNVKMKRKLKHHGVWTIVFLIYTHIVHTCMSILNCPKVIDRDGSSKSRWFPNGNIECFTGGHLPLTLVSLFVLLLSLLLIPVVAAIATGKLAALNVWQPRLQMRKQLTDVSASLFNCVFGDESLQHIFKMLIAFYIYGTVCLFSLCAIVLFLKGWEWMKNFQASLSEGYKERFNWWAAVELSRRVFFIFLVILYPRQQVAVLLLLCIILSLYGFCQPYKSPEVNVIEQLVQLNSIILLKLVSSGMLEPYYTLSQENNSTIEYCVATSRTAVATWLLLPFYYFPILLLLIFITIGLGRYMRSKMKTKMISLRETTDTNHQIQDPEYTSNYFSLHEVIENEVFLSNKNAEEDMVVVTSVDI